MQITINVDEATGQMSVEAEGMEPYACESVEECLEHVEQLLRGGEMDAEADAAAGEMPEGDMAAMWDEEAAKRPMNPNMMR